MVVVAIVAIASVGVVASLPDPARGQLEKEAVRLASLLDTARAYSRASGLPVIWKATDNGFRFEGLPKAAAAALDKESHWLAPEVHTDPALSLVLGPEPMIAAQSVILQLNAHRLMIQTNGLGPFAVAPVEELRPVANGATP